MHDGTPTHSTIIVRQCFNKNFPDHGYDVTVSWPVGSIYLHTSVPFYADLSKTCGRYFGRAVANNFLGSK